jgi:uncharacterized protein YdbL (DUF1318 family)
MTMRRIVWTWAGVFVLGALCSVARAATTQELQLQKRFQERYPKLLEQKSAGKIGETFQGFVEAVKDDYAKEEAVSSLVNGENADRTELYKLLAAQQKITPEVVAERNAVRNFQRARAGDYLKGQDGRWTQKK